ncbi:MAG TPA: hypothetical protein VKV33_11725, partial [Streptosporangiaceae bacterium]|nr:hypothetical protein [Streptosporangiaceae bacterium]
LASLLGVHIQTAVNWAGRTRRDWTAYLAERGKGRHPSAREGRSSRISAPVPRNHEAVAYWAAVFIMTRRLTRYEKGLPPVKGGGGDCKPPGQAASAAA